MDYPAVTQSSTFTVTVTPCEVVSLQPVVTADQVYEVNSASSLVFTVEEFIQLPACNSQINYGFAISANAGSSF